MNYSEANKIYDILVEMGGASESMRSDFVHYHTIFEKATEWRFQGRLGNGGKYWNERNCVTCYPEDETPFTMQLIALINESLITTK